MNEDICLLKKFNINNYFDYPYPHIIIYNALDEDIYNHLAKNYPNDKIIFESNLNNINKKMKENTRYQIKGFKCINNDNIDNLWKRFVEYHTSKEFYIKVMKIFNKEIDDTEVLIRKLSKDNPKDKILLDCQIGINTPNSIKSTVRDAHIDSSEEIYAGLFYMKDENDLCDENNGGNLDIYEINNKNNDDFFLNKGKNLINKNIIKKFKTINYSKNTFVLFLNSDKAIHGVTERQPNNISRKLINIIAEKL